MAQIGTIRMSTGSGTISVPVFPAGDSGSQVYEFIRISTDTGVGFVPITVPSEATYDFIRINTSSQGVLAVHDDDHTFRTVVLVLDESGSLSSTEQQEQEDTAKTIVNNLPSNYPIALVSFDDFEQLENNLTTDKSAITGSIDALGPYDGGSNLPLGIDAANEILSGDDVSDINPSSFADPNSDHIMVCMTDKDTIDSDDINAADNAKSKGQKIFAVNFRTDSINNLSDITSDPDSTFYHEVDGNATTVGQTIANEIENL